MSTQQDKLVKELVACRDVMMGVLYDLAMEEGRESDALGWQWLRQYRKYPSPRVPNRTARNKTYAKTCWGWSFNRGPGYYQDPELRGDILRLRRRIAQLEFAENRAGPTGLPVTLLDESIMVSTPVATEEHALLLAAVAMGELLTLIKRAESKI